MTWINDIQKALRYIENNLFNEPSPDDVAGHICVSGSNFGRIFGIVTGFSVAEYIRLRKLSMAGQELSGGKCKVIDIALKYGYDSPESFTKAFVRFHGITPSEAKNNDKSLKIFAPFTIEMNIKGGYVMTRKLIPNVEKLYDNPAENYMFPSCMRSAMWALGEDKAFDFLFFAGVTGDLFVQTWGLPKWQYNDSYSTICQIKSDILSPIKSAFDVCGYDYEYVPKEEIQKDKTIYIQKIVESIDNGIPVLTFGIVGPPICSIIFGYDENGDVLIGWSQFTDETNPDIPTDLYCAENYFQKRNGLDKSNALVFIGEKRHKPSIAAGIHGSLKNIPALINLPSEERVLFGRKAFDAWADSLLDDSCFQNEDMLVSPLDTYGSCIVQIGTNMHYMQEYLNRASDLCSNISTLIDDLKRAYQYVKDALQKVIDFQGGYFFDADRNALLRNDFRVKLSELIRELGARYMDVADVVKIYDF